MPNYRTDWCGEISRKQIGEKVILAGWVQGRRDHGSLIFIDLRDRSGLLQLVFDRERNREFFELAARLRGEYVVTVEGLVVERDPESINPKLPTGELELRVDRLELLNSARTAPFYIEDDLNVDENLRLRYRYLDLRRPEMYRRLAQRHRAAMLLRDYLDKRGYLEVETPALTRSTPEGARDFLIPSRTSRGSFYALPQSPQLFKQLLMVAGVERYFQLARCFRDEDLRADRQPEFTQIDIEASFISEDQLFEMVEGMMAALYREMAGAAPATPFPRLTYREAMERYGSDKPDLRFAMELADISELARSGSFKVFQAALEAGGVVKGLRVPGGGKLSRKELDDLTGLAGRFGAKGLAWMIREENGWRSPVAKFFEQGLLEAIGRQMQAQPGDLLLFVADNWATSCSVLGQLRLQLGRQDKPPEAPNFLWVVDFPLFEYSDEEEGYISTHHPFTAPCEEDLHRLAADPLSVRARAYDLVLNGVELGSGSIRIHRRELQEQIFRLLGLSFEETAGKFGFLLEAFEYGAPPHGGIALGLDRLVTMITGDDSIRQVIAFPKTAGGGCLLTGAPAPVEDRQLLELGISLKKDDGK